MKFHCYDCHCVVQYQIVVGFEFFRIVSQNHSPRFCFRTDPCCRALVPATLNLLCDRRVDENPIAHGA